ncbi:hypothetical protein NP493_255g01001 [Ridgeia piscesae]|uniref:Uncharacterized protein n=1 Tax=Ridgeia piscesae TaxID=27915 RepID=A0AAD9NYC7_RIDPI|nr:hypothetical protein NP493_255g01001 [Ridgeia piscesae]
MVKRKQSGQCKDAVGDDTDCYLVRTQKETERPMQRPKGNRAANAKTQQVMILIVISFIHRRKQSGQCKDPVGDDQPSSTKKRPVGDSQHKASSRFEGLYGDISRHQTFRDVTCLYVFTRPVGDSLIGRRQSRRVASRRVASRRVASRRVASRFGQGINCAADTNDTTAVRVSESNITRTDGMDDMKVSTEGICAINTFPVGVSPKKDGTGDESEMMDDAEKGKEESEKGRDGAELKEEQEAEGSLSEDSIVYTTECITLEQSGDVNTAEEVSRECGSSIAALGLAENSPVILVASMLPVRSGGGWGKQWGCNLGQHPNVAHSRDAARGLTRSLWVGILIAVPSGAGVALSILGGNIGSLGMLWACSIVSAIHDVTTGADVWRRPSWGVVSLVLTLINIVCIFLVGIFILKLKEVAPHGVPKDTEVFWKKDIKVARDTYRTIKTGTMSDLASTAREIAQEWKVVT